MVCSRRPEMPAAARFALGVTNFLASGGWRQAKLAPSNGCPHDGQRRALAVPR